jgi:raffinose/stachyose/melibiose transport system permease protein
MNNSSFRENKIMLFLSQSFLIFGSVIVIGPVLFVFLTSLKDNQEFFTNIFGLPSSFKWTNYSTAWNIGKLGNYFFNSVFVTVTSVLLTAITAILGGYALAKLHIPKANLIISALMTFTFIPGIAIYISLYTMMSTVRMIGNLWTLILPYAAWQIPFSMYIIKQYFETIPEELIESGRIDGCNELQAFINIMLPLIIPAIATIIVFNFIGNWGELMWANIATAASLAIKTLPVGLLNFKSEMGVQWGQYCAGICMVTIPLVIVFSYFQKYFVAGLTNGAIKG